MNCFFAFFAFVPGVEESAIAALADIEQEPPSKINTKINVDNL